MARYHSHRMAGRRKIKVEDTRAWVFNRMAHVYDARPPYPHQLIEQLHQLAGEGGTIADIGAGIGHLAIPLAKRAHCVLAVEPAQAMLERLERTASENALPITPLHAAAEALPIESASVDLAIIADALHFLDAALAGREVARVLKPTGALAIISCELGDSEFMRALIQLMEQSAPRRPRATSDAIRHVAALAGVSLQEQTFIDETPVDHEELERILRSISFIGPAMNAQRFDAFRRHVRALTPAPSWVRNITLRIGQRTK